MTNKGLKGLVSEMLRRGCVLTLFVVVCVPAVAELQNVQVGGEIKIRGRYWRNVYTNHINSAPVAPYAARFLGRALGPSGIASRYDWDGRGADLKYWEQKTKLHVRADFTNDLSAVTTLETCDVWGEDFRSDYLTGLDFRSANSNGVEFTQAYIETRDMWNSKLDVRMGRQPIKLGKGWLVSDQISGTIALFFDGIRATYDMDDFIVDAWWTKLDENTPLEEDADVDFYGVSASYTGWKPATITAYWLWVRDAREVHDTNASYVQEWLENALEFDQYDGTNLHTLGLRVNGKHAAWDYDWELAYQFGDAAQVGQLFTPFVYGDDDATFDAWASDLEVGYTFDAHCKPRVYAGGAYFSGDDDRGVSLWKGESSQAFNRLFCGAIYSWILDLGQDLTNFYQVRAGVDAQLTEAITARLQAAYFGVSDTAEIPCTVDVFGQPAAVLPDWPFFTEDGDDSIGTLLYASLKYNYSEDLYIAFVCEHLFTGDGITNGNYVYRNGLEFSAGTDDEDASFFMIETGLRF